MNVLAAILIVVGLFFLNIFLLRKNRSTPVPAGCENLKPDCRACGIADCTMRETPLRKEEKDGNR